MGTRTLPFVQAEAVRAGFAFRPCLECKPGAVSGRLNEFSGAATVSTPVLETELLLSGIPIDDVSVREYRTAKQIDEV